MSWRLWVRRRTRRIRRRLGLPRLSRRDVLLILLVFASLAYVSVTVFADFFTKLGQYTPLHYEPKDFEREKIEAEPGRQEGGPGR